ncbi:unnamed protein product [Rotaria magnacalcarata]|nr:unnamed protein product [Rotaria magnacalcarata]
MHQVYDNIFKDTPAADVKLIVGNKNRRSGKTELICKRPKQSLLINKPVKNNKIRPLHISQDSIIIWQETNYNSKISALFQPASLKIKQSYSL